MIGRFELTVCSCVHSSSATGVLESDTVRNNSGDRKTKPGMTASIDPTCRQYPRQRPHGGTCPSPFAIASLSNTDLAKSLYRRVEAARSTTETRHISSGPPAQTSESGAQSHPDLSADGLLTMIVSVDPPLSHAGTGGPQTFPPRVQSRRIRLPAHRKARPSTELGEC